MRPSTATVTISIAAILISSVLRSGAAPAEPSVTAVSPSDVHLQFEGRWARTESADTTVNSGSRLLLRFSGRHVAGLFDVSTITNPSQIYVRIDDGPPVRYVVDRPRLDFTPLALGPGTHSLELDVRDVDERANRWIPPLQSGLILTGFQLDAGGRTLAGPPLPSRTMEFLGDSITQGVRAVSPQIGPDGADATKDYAWLVGTALHTDFAQVGFGAQGIVAPGGGNVPPAPAAFGFDFAGAPVDAEFQPDVVVVNQGTNDGRIGSAQFEPAYEGYLHQIRTAWPHATIIGMRPFNGAHAADIAAAVQATGDPVVHYVDTSGWLRRDEFTDGLHPTVAGHEVAARHLASIVAALTGWTPTTIPAPTTRLLTGFEDGSAAGWSADAYIASVQVSDQPPAGGAPAYGGSFALDTTSTVAPLNEWRTISFTPDRPLALPAPARDVFVYVSAASNAPALYDARISVRSGSVTSTAGVDDIPNLARFLPWDRVHVNLPTGHRAIDQITVGVRGEGTSASGALSFQIDDLGVTDRIDG